LPMQDTTQAQTFLSHTRGEENHADSRRSFPRLNVTRDLWQSLAWLSFYRWLVAIILTIAPLTGYGSRLLGITHPTLFAAGCIALLALALCTTTLYTRRWPRLGTQIHLHACGDIALIILLVYAAGGANSGLAMLLIPPIAAVG